MVVSRWVFFDANAQTSFTAEPTTGISGTGTYGYVEGAVTAAPTITISAGISDQMLIGLDGNTSQQITLTPGSNLDIRMVCREIEFKGKQLVGTHYDHFSCRYVNNKVRVYSGKLGTSSQATVGLGGNNCLHLLGMAPSQGGPVTVTTVNGAASTNNGAYTGQVTVGGSYKGQFSEIYQVTIGTQHPVGSATVSGTYAGTVTTNGFWNHTSNETYTINLNTTNGAVMNAGSGNVPRFTVTSTLGDNVATLTELLYSDYYYEIGTRGLRVKFSDSPFGATDTISIACSAIQFAQGSNAAAAVGSAQYIVSAMRENKVTTPVTTQTTGTAVGNSGLTIAFSNSGSLTAKDKFTLIASQTQPSVLGGTTLNFGSVTVSTYSPTQVVWFELLSGATRLSNTKFGLNSHGSAQHHFTGNNDTKFAFGNVGEGSPSSNNSQWKTGVDGATDLASDTPPVYLAATEDNLAETNTAAGSEPIGVAKGEMVSDYIYMAIKLGASETGANSTIVYRMFFDFS